MIAIQIILGAVFCFGSLIYILEPSSQIEHLPGKFLGWLSFWYTVGCFVEMVVIHKWGEAIIFLLLVIVICNHNILINKTEREMQIKRASLWGVVTWLIGFAIMFPVVF